MHKVIQVDNLSKSYRLFSCLPPQPLSFWDRARRQISGVFSKRESETFWALNNLSFSVNSGEILGIIGRNGSGKSTLLKILSRITPPTQGRAQVHGSFSSLLEVGTGFHPELTGRENIFLNGTILGMKRSEIRKKFDEIIAFSEVEKFLDTPVKYYSSGMYVRLAFAVAAHLEPEILAVDEVLAVGDGGFQQKCLGKIKDVAGHSRTVLFVSHNLLAIRALCTRVIVLDAGKIVHDGNVEVGITHYTKLVHCTEGLSNQSIGNRLERATGAIRFTEVKATDSNGNTRWSFMEGETIRIRMKYKIHSPVPSFALLIFLRSSLTREIITSIKEIISTTPLSPSSDVQTLDLILPNVSLRAGDYSLFIWIGDEACDVSWDVLDENVDLPWLTVTAKEIDREKLQGYFSMPSQIVKHQASLIE